MRQIFLRPIKLLTPHQIRATLSNNSVLLIIIVLISCRRCSSDSGTTIASSNSICRLLSTNCFSFSQCFSLFALLLLLVHKY
ncbi:MAG: hypothetical protein MHMPM18_003951 [Marteilia pararefringens]